MNYSISVFQTEREDVNTVNVICALLDTAAQMGCWTSLECATQVLQHEYFTLSEYLQNDSF